MFADLPNAAFHRSFQYAEVADETVGWSVPVLGLFHPDGQNNDIGIGLSAGNQAVKLGCHSS